MPHFIGEPKYLQECQPGDLVRLSHRGQSRFAFAFSGNTSGSVDRVAVLDPADKFPFVSLRGDEIVVCYGKSYVIREGMQPDALVEENRFVPGAISWRRSQGEASATLMGTSDAHAAYGDLETGRTSQQRGGAGFNLLKWSVILTLSDGTEAVEAFDSAATPA